MLLRLILLFTVVPAIELVLLLVVGQQIGIVPTVGLIATTGVLGAWLARRQGLDTLNRLQREIREGRMPGSTLVEGMMILIAGAVLLTPGFLTDALGFTLLIPASRAALGRLVVARLAPRVTVIRPGTPGEIVIDAEPSNRDEPTPDRALDS